MDGTLPSKKLVSEIGLEAVAIGFEPGVEVDRARLLLAFEYHSEVDRQVAARVHEGLDGPDVHV
jgi:hypothetical protein